MIFAFGTGKLNEMKTSHALLLKIFIAFILVSCSSMSAEDYLFEGQRSMRRQNIDEAFEFFNKAIQKDPNLSQAYLERGRAFFNKGESDKAISDFDKAIELSPDYAEAYISRGRAYQFKGDMYRACENWQKAEEHNFPGIEEYLRMCTPYL